MFDISDYNTKMKLRVFGCVLEKGLRVTIFVKLQYGCPKGWLFQLEGGQPLKETRK